MYLLFPVAAACFLLCEEELAKRILSKVRGNNVYLTAVCLALGECVVVEVFGSYVHCAHSIYSPQESGPGPSWAAGAAAAAAAGVVAVAVVVGAAGCHSKVQRRSNTGQRRHSQTWGSRL